jgi:hypothetical protein
MVKGLEIRTGVTGYRDQLARTRRLRNRILNQHYPFIVDYQDDVFAFFQNCWHLKDWVRNDPLVPQKTKDRIKRAAESSPTLAICNDMASGTKHLKLHGAKAGASHSHLRIANQGQIDCVIDVDGLQLSARVLARKCVEEWERILGDEGLPTGDC